MSKFVSTALEAMFSGPTSGPNFRAIGAGLDAFGVQAGLDRPHRLVHFLAQCAHETDGFRLDTEVWGPTPEQQRYEGRVSLGNTEPGDGKKYLGRTAIQLTGRSNYVAFREWCKRQGMTPPDFEASPELVNTDPWEGLAPIHYWMDYKLNALADVNDIEQITKKINGGLNGFDSRLNWYTHIGLVMCGFAPSDIVGFQTAAKHKGFYSGGIDGDSGPQTRAAIHKWLAADPSNPVTVAAAPVVEHKPVPVPVPVPVAPKGAEKTGVMRIASAVALAGPTVSAAMPSGDWPRLIFFGIGILGVLAMLWRGELIASRVKSVLASFDGA